VYITSVEDERGKRKKKPKRRPRKYDKAVFIALRKIWVICGEQDPRREKKGGAEVKYMIINQAV
jgi:hypothetical protein